MRQGQQNRRGRGRNNNNRKGGGHHHNPLARSFESNGPDVKIRGTPAHIAEKYMALARDAQTSGDPVLAENYLQHAEHYSRIIMAYREQLNPQQGEGMNGNGQRMRAPGEMGDAADEFGDDDGNDATEDAFPQAFVPQVQQPIRHENNRHEGNNRNDNNNRHDRPFRRDQGRNRERFNDRNDRGERMHQGESRHSEGRPQAPDRQPESATEGGNDPRRRDRFQQPHEQPEFLRRPVRRARSESDEAEKDDTSRD